MKVISGSEGSVVVSPWNECFVYNNGNELLFYSNELGVCVLHSDDRLDGDVVRLTMQEIASLITDEHGSSLIDVTLVIGRIAEELAEMEGDDV